MDTEPTVTSESTPAVTSSEVSSTLGVVDVFTAPEWDW